MEAFIIAALAISIGTGATAANLHTAYNINYGDGIPDRIGIISQYGKIVDYQMTVKTAIQTGNNIVFQWASNHPNNIHSKKILDELEKQTKIKLN